MSDRPTTRTSLARHAVHRSPHPLRQIIVALGAIAAVALASVGAVGAYAVWDATRAVEDNSVALAGDDASTMPPAIGEIEGGVNLLIVGTDSCEGPNTALSGACQENDTEGERNDVTLLVHISDAPRRVTVVSFPRDMLVPIPACTGEDGTQYSAMSEQMLNVSYSHGGLSCTAMTITELTGVDIRFAAATRWTGVITMSDAIGGVDVCLADDIVDPYTGLNLAAGTRTLQGVEALQFLRMRHGIGDQSDLARISNQQQFMSSMVRKLQSDGVLGNPATLFTLATTAVKEVNDGQIVLSRWLANPQRMVQIAMAVRSVPYSDIVFVQYPTVYTEGGGRVLPVTEAADTLFAALTANQPLQLSGATSDGDGTEVVGEATAPAATPGESGAPTDPPLTEAAAPVETAAVLPPSITGQTAAQITCTVGQR